MLIIRVRQRDERAAKANKAAKMRYAAPIALMMAGRSERIGHDHQGRALLARASRSALCPMFNVRTRPTTAKAIAPSHML